MLPLSRSHRLTELNNISYGEQLVPPFATCRIVWPRYVRTTVSFRSTSNSSDEFGATQDRRSRSILKSTC